MKATKEIMTGAMLKLNQLASEIIELEGRTESEGIEERVENWILMNWLIELELARQAKDTLEKWVRNLEFPI